MPLFYKSVQSAVKSKDGSKKWHPKLIKVGKAVSTQKLSHLIAEKSSLTPGDVYNVIYNLMSVVRDQLMESHSVKLDGLGTFTVIATSRGNGADTADEVNPLQINNLRIRFTPIYSRIYGEGIVKPMFHGVKFERWGSKRSKKPTSR
jgi:predicted histone-like DNA-binding protein